MESIHELLANDLVNASVPICWETHITAFNSLGGTDISGGVAGDMCSGEQKIRGNTSPLHRRYIPQTTRMWLYGFYECGAGECGAGFSWVATSSLV